MDRELHRRIVKKLLDEGPATAQEIADAVGRDSSTVRDHMRRESFANRKGRSPVSNKAALLWDLTHAARYPPSKRKTEPKAMSHPAISE